MKLCVMIHENQKDHIHVYLKTPGHYTELMRSPFDETWSEVTEDKYFEFDYDDFEKTGLESILVGAEQ